MEPEESVTYRTGKLLSNNKYPLLTEGIIVAIRHTLYGIRHTILRYDLSLAASFATGFFTDFSARSLAA